MKLVQFGYRRKRIKADPDVPIVIRDLREKFYMVDDAYLNGHARKCGIAATGVYNVLCRHAGHEQSCFPSFKLIADKLGISKSTVKRALDILEYYKIIRVSRTYGESNEYFLTDKKCWKRIDDMRVSKTSTGRG